MRALNRQIQLLFLGMVLSCLLGAASPGQAAGFSLQPGDILAANYGGNTVLKIDTVSGKVQSLGQFDAPTGVALTTNGFLYISEAGSLDAEMPGYIYRLRLTNGVLELVNPLSTMYSIQGMVLAPDGDLIVSCGTDNRIVRVNPATGSETTISSNNLLFGVSGIAMLDAQNVVVCSTFNNSLVKVSLINGAQSTIPTTGGGIDMPTGVAVYGGNIYMNALDSREVRRVPVTGGTVTTFYSAQGYPFGMAVETNGNLVTGTGGAALEVLRISPTGALLRSYTDPLISEIKSVVISSIQLTAQGLTNTPPLLEAIPDQWVEEAGLLSFYINATDTNWPPAILTYSLEAGSPVGATVSPDGLFSWEPTEAQGPSNYVFTVRVTDDATPGLFTTGSFNVLVDEVNSPPTIIGLTNRTVYATSLVNFTAAAYDADLPPQILTYSLEPGAPSGATISPQGEFNWMPPQVLAASNYLIGIRVTDGGVPPLGHTANFTVRVLPTNHPPVPSSPRIERYANAGAKVLISAVLGTDVDGDPVALYSLASSSLLGGTVATNGEWIIYTPAAGFTNDDSFTYQVSDGRGGIAQGTVQVAVIPDNRPSQNLLISNEGPGGMRIRCSGIPGENYRVQVSTNLMLGSWETLTNLTADTHGMFEYRDAPPAGAPQRFYRSVTP